MLRAAAVVLASFALAASPSVGSQSPAVASCTAEDGPARAFDFWIGEWAVFAPDSDQRLGSNRIERRENGCLVLESWTGARGSTGLSMNFHDPHRDRWRQIWQSAGALIELEGGLDAEGRMAMEGTIFNHATGERAAFRGRWTPVDEDRVLQEFWQQDAEGVWQTWFVGDYRRLDPAVGR